jgi:hypothetical protein
LRDDAIAGLENLRLLSCGTRTFKYDMVSEDAAGNQDSTISVFTRDSSGARRFYTGHRSPADDETERGIDRLTPVYDAGPDAARTGRSVCRPCV